MSKRKENKLRPYRVDYFFWSEMLKDKALVRSIVIRAVTAVVAKQELLDSVTVKDGKISILTAFQLENHRNLDLNIYSTLTESDRELTVIRAYRFYRKLTAEPLRKMYVPLDKLLPAKRAIEVMTEIENLKAPALPDLPASNIGNTSPIYGYDPPDANPLEGEYPANSIE